MRADEDVRQVPERALRRQRLALENVERRSTQSVRAKRIDESGLVDDVAAGDVHEDRARPQKREAARVEQVVRLVRVRGREHDDVSLWQHVVERNGGGELVDAELLRRAA